MQKKKDASKKLSRILFKTKQVYRQARLSFEYSFRLAAAHCAHIRFQDDSGTHAKVEPINFMEEQRVSVLPFRLA